MRTAKIVGTIGVAVFIVILLSGLSYVTNYGKEAVTVVDQEIRPAVIQEKYEWFQGEKASIDSLGANIQNQIEAAKLKRSMMPDNKSDWGRIDKAEYSQSVNDIVGVISQRNSVIRDYNSAMSQWQMSIANLGKWPEGSKYSKEDFEEFPKGYPEYSYGEELKQLRD